MIRKRIAFAGSVLLVASLAWAGDAAPKTRPTGGYPPPLPPGPQSVEVRGQGAPRNTTAASSGAGALQGVALKAIAEGKAEITVDGSPRSLRPGDALAGYVVSSISGGRVVLLRGIPGQATPDATAILTLGATGLTRVRIYSTKDPTLPPASVAR